MSITTELVNHYPWLPSLKKYYSEISQKAPNDFISEIFSENLGRPIKERLLKLFEAAFNNLEEISDYKGDKLNVYVYILLKIFIYAFNNRMITNRLANLYSKITYNELINENSDSILFNICQDLGLEIRYYDPPVKYGKKIVRDHQEKLEASFTIYFIDYLRLASNLRDDYRRLAHNSILDGYIFIQKERLIRLIQEYVRNKLLIKETEDKDSLEQFLKKVSQIEDFKEIYDKIIKDWDERKEEFEFTFQIDFKNTKDLLTLYPPCVKEILKKAQDGQNLNHSERLFIVWFLLALDYPVEKVVNVFSTLPDFDREKTMYQVNFAKKKKYVPYKCLTLKSLNLCLAASYKDELCLDGYGSKERQERKKIAHPLRYTRIKQYRVSRAQKYAEKELDKKNE